MSFHLALLSLAKSVCNSWQISSVGATTFLISYRRHIAAVNYDFLREREFFLEMVTLHQWVSTCVLWPPLGSTYRVCVCVCVCVCVFHEVSISISFHIWAQWVQTNYFSSIFGKKIVLTYIALFYHYFKTLLRFFLFCNSNVSHRPNILKLRYNLYIIITVY